MTLIKSISGIRGTIGGRVGNNLTPIDVVECVSGFGMWLKNQNAPNVVVIGRDGRISGNMVLQLATQTLLGMGIDVIDVDYSTTPTVEMMVTHFNAGAGIICTASHNPMEWNALKFLNQRGEFISAEDGKTIIQLIDNKNIEFAPVTELGQYRKVEDAISIHIQKILAYDLVQVDKIKAAKLKVVVDCINSTGDISIPPLLDKLGIEYSIINSGDYGHFAHNPEPLANHLTELSLAVKNANAHCGISIDPDVDRLAFVCEDGSMFGEEYTLVAVADYILGKKSGSTVSNLSSTRALAAVTEKHGNKYYASAVGEVNVVNTMKEVKAVIGGEGNGGIIVPDFHYGRDAMIGVALFMSHLSEKGMSVSELRDSYPAYIMIKDKLDLDATIDLNTIYSRLATKYADERTNTIDGFKIDFSNGWVHLRPSNTEPIIRIYCEAKTKQEAEILIDRVKSTI